MLCFSNYYNVILRNTQDMPFYFKNLMNLMNFTRPMHCAISSLLQG